MQIIEEVIHEEEEVEEEEVRKPVVEMPRPVEPELLLPQQTYHHMIGRSFGVAFNDRSFIRPEAAALTADRYYYGGHGTCTFCSMQLGL